ncbi:hypothetical protein C8J56DRAFT_885293 [Mycena floridula]|nr:hypothetical protein C8J56DRAFT_885293 [Mycena floridula]
MTFPPMLNSNGMQKEVQPQHFWAQESRWTFQESLDACSSMSAKPRLPSDLDFSDNPDAAEEDEWYANVYGHGGDPDILRKQRDEVIEEEDGERHIIDWDEDLDDEVFCEEMMELAQDQGDNADDEDWVPANVQRQRKKRAKEQKGPVIENKAERTQRRYRDAQRGQTKLTGFTMFQNAAVPMRRPRSRSPSPSESVSALLPKRAQRVPKLPADSFPMHSRSAAPSPDPTNEIPEAEPGDEQDFEEWELEGEVINLMPSTVPEIKPWNILWDQIKADLKKKSKTLPLSKVNQLMILRNFATLRLKGHGKMDASQHIAQQWHEDEGVHFARRVRALARHYQLYEQLPIERRGGEGYRKTQSLLLDETVKTAAHSWLMSQKVGAVTPQKFRCALNEDILPSLNITLAKDLCERTARRWLVKLGFHRTVLQKGIYKDGHDRDDVKKYRDKEFLPKMEKLEARMTQYQLVNGVLEGTKPTLGPGEREVIAMFQDECCFHANDYKTSAWFVSFDLA